MLVTNSAGFLIEKAHLDIRPQLVNIVHADSQEFTPNETDNWSRIAWRKLGDGRRWWIIADYSQIIDPFSDLKPKKKYKYVTQLTVGVPSNTAALTTITVGRAKSISKGDVLLIEDLDPAHAVTLEVSVLGVNPTTNVVTLSPFTSPAGGFPAALSRVSRVYRDQLRLVIPSPNRAFFEAVNFGNPMNVLTE